jgi:hypothetical protein
MNTTSIPEFATAELTYRRARIAESHRHGIDGVRAHAARRWHRPVRHQHAA